MAKTEQLTRGQALAIFLGMVGLLFGIAALSLLGGHPNGVKTPTIPTTTSQTPVDPSMTNTTPSKTINGDLMEQGYVVVAVVANAVGADYGIPLSRMEANVKGYVSPDVHDQLYKTWSKYDWAVLKAEQRVKTFDVSTQDDITDSLNLPQGQFGFHVVGTVYESANGDPQVATGSQAWIVVVEKSGAKWVVISLKQES